MWFGLLLLLVVIVGIVLVYGPKIPTTRLYVPQSKKYRIWTPATLNGVEGRYYMAAYGVTQASAEKIIATASLKQSKPITPQQAVIAAATIAIGTIVFYWRPKGDVSPFTPAKHLAPIGNFADITSDDVFTLTYYPDSKETLIQVPAIDNAHVTSCDKPEKCRNGTLGFGGIVTGSSLQFVDNGNGVFITRSTPSGPQALVTGTFLCPYQPENGKISDMLIQACAAGSGGPRIPRMDSSGGDVYFLEVV